MKTFALIVLLALASTSQGWAEDLNVALASNGTKIEADSEWLNSSFDTGGQAPASRLIDGIIRAAADNPAANRWHSDLAAPHPHWVWLHFPRPARIHRVVLWRADLGSPVDFVGQYTPDNGRTLVTLFRREGVAFSADHSSEAADFPPVVADNFRLLITRSSNHDFPNYTQASELQVFGEWAGEAPVPAPKPQPDRTVGEMKPGPMPAHLQSEVAADAITFTSPWLKISFALNRPAVVFLSLDASGQGHHSRNLLKAPQGIDLLASGWEGQATSADASFTVSRVGNKVVYSGIRLGDLETVDLAFTANPRTLHIALDRTVPREYMKAASSPLRMLFDGRTTPVSPMGRLKSRAELAFPVFLHFPDYGSLLVTTRGSEATLGFAGNRPRAEVELSLRQGREVTPDKIAVQRAGRFHTDLDFRMVDVYPEQRMVDADPKLAGVKRGWLNIFGFRPDVACLSNNSLSDNCMFCMYEYADQARFTPPLFDGFTALDLVRTSLDTYFDGQSGYGGDRGVFVDTDPAIVISAYDYATGRPDPAWLKRRIKDIEGYADHILAADRNGDGLAESARSGNSGAGGNGAGEWSSNWWDVISFGGNDAYGIALDYRAFRCATDLETRVGDKLRARRYAHAADRIKAVYYPTFFDPATGVLAGWRSKDGQLHDYYFAFVNGIAIAYGLVTPEQGNAIMDRLQAKFREVGYHSYRLGLPGNLIPVARKDYAGGGVLGQPHLDDGSDSFQSYENGAATGSFAYFYVQALYTLGRKAEADEIFNAMLEGYRDGVFQNGVGSGVDWKRWDGTPCGYEGLLTDTYYALTSFMTGRLGHGVPMP
jgi:hypothetical protein